MIEDQAMIHRITGEPITSIHEIRQGDIYRVVCDDGVERLGMIGFTQSDDLLFFPAEVMSKPITDLVPKRQRSRR